MRPTQSEETCIGFQNTLIPCPNCGEVFGVRDSAQAFEGDWVNECWKCGFMWTQEV